MQNQSDVDRTDQNLINLEVISTDNPRVDDTDQVASSNGPETQRSAGSRALASARFGTIPEGSVENEQTRFGAAVAEKLPIKP